MVSRRIVVVAVVAVLGAGSASAQAQSWRPPADEQRCPSKWGPGDQRGAANHMKPETVLRAARLIRTGQVFELGRVLSGEMPLSPTRRFELLTKRTVMSPESNRRGSNEEMVLAEIGQVGTQFDGFAHQTVGNSMYNCFKVDETATRSGFSKLGIEHVGAIMTRGVLIDVAALKEWRTPDTYDIGRRSDQALPKELTLQPGDAVIIHTAGGRCGGKDNARYMKTAPWAPPRANGWRVRTRSSSEPTTRRSTSLPIPIKPCPIRSIKSCSSSTAFTSWST